MQTIKTYEPTLKSFRKWLRDFPDGFESDTYNRKTYKENDLFVEEHHRVSFMNPNDVAHRKVYYRYDDECYQFRFETNETVWL